MATSCTLSMNTVDPNPGICQSQCCCCSGDGGASNLSGFVNSVGRWGTVILATTQGKPVVTGKTAVGAQGSRTVGGGMSGASLVLILIIVGVFIFLLRK